MKKTLYSIVAIRSNKYEYEFKTDMPIKMNKWLKFTKLKNGRFGFKYKSV